MTTRTRAIHWKIARRHLNQRRPPRLRWVLLAATLLLLMTSGVSAGAGVYFAAHLPSASKFRVHYDFQDARIYDSRGDLLYNMADLARSAGKRIVEPLQDQHDQSNPCRGGVNRIPRLLQDATIATEDATFYKNPGFDPGSILRAAYQDILYGHIVSGASTITQQVVRNAHLVTDQRSLTRKAQEVALAYELSRRVSKRRILWYYLNTVPYANTAIGAQAAAEVYFGRPVCSIDQAQAALLAGLPRAPTVYDPVRHPQAALARMGTVLQLLRRHGYLHYAWQVQAARAESRTWHFRAPQAPMRYPQFTRYVVDQLKRLPVLRNRLYAGIDVYTTLNPKLQNMAQQTVTRQIRGLQAQHVTNGALVSLDLRPGHYGWIDAMVGSAHSDARSQQINMATTPRQPGSSMKPFNYIWAFAHSGVGPGTTVNDTPIKLPDPNNTEQHGWYTPQNYDHRWHGAVTLREALANSLNVPAVKVEYYLTHPANVARTAYRFGMSSLYRDNPGLDCSVCYAVTLGGLSRGTRLVEETAAYGVFAAQGSTVPPVAIWKIVLRSTGQVVYCSASCPGGVQPDAALAAAKRQVVDPSHAYEMTSVLSDNGARCTVQVCEFGLNSPLQLSRPAAAKTGTTNAWTDNWTVGYVPQMVTGVWVGNADRTPMHNVIGVTGAAPIWHDYMERAFRMLRLPTLWYRQPASVIQTDQCGNPTAFHLVSTDLFVPGVVNGPLMPLCSLPERGYMPVPCSRYPRNFNGFPRPADCNSRPSYLLAPNAQGQFSGPLQQGYTYYNTPNGPVYTLNNGTTYQSPSLQPNAPPGQSPQQFQGTTQQ